MAKSIQGLDWVTEFCTVAAELGIFHSSDLYMEG